MLEWVMGVYMYAVHIHVEGGEFWEKLNQENPLSTPIAVKVCAPKSGMQKSTKVRDGRQESRGRRNPLTLSASHIKTCSSSSYPSTS